MRNNSASIKFGSSTQSKLNNIFAFILVIFLSISPIPLGSNRPIFWAISALSLAIIAIIYIVCLISQQSELKRKPTQIKSIFIPYLFLLAFIILQIIPFGEWISPLKSMFDNSIIIGKTISLTPSLSLLSFIQFASYGLLFFLMLQIAYNVNRAEKIIITLFIIITLYAIYALMALSMFGDTILFLEKWAYYNNATGTFVNRNSFATFLSFGLIIGVAFTVASLLPNDATTKHQKNLLLTTLYFLGSAIIFAALISTQSRMGFFAGFVGSIITIALIISKAPKTRLLKWPVFLFAILAIIVLFFLYAGGLLERLATVDSAADGRLTLYKQIIVMISSNPLTGYGAGSFELSFPLFHQLPLSPDVVWDKAHNTYLALWAELGIIFGSIPIIIVVLITLFTWRIYKTAQKRWLQAAISLGIITTASIHSLVDFSLEIQAAAYIFVAILAIGMSGSQKTRIKNNED